MNLASTGYNGNYYFMLSFFYSPKSAKRYFDIGELRFIIDSDCTQEAEFSSSLCVCQFINQCLNFTRLDSEKPYLLIINPQSGKRLGKRIFDNCISKLFKFCNIKYELLLTVKPLHAQQFVEGCESLNKYRGIVTVSGDGLIYEVFSGLMGRASWREDLDSVPVSVIPAGSGNGLAASICAFSGVNPDGKIILYSTLLLRQPVVQSLDLMKVQLSTGLQMPSFLSLTWGLLADVDVGSDKYRWMGPTRFTVAAAIQVAKMNKYKGKLWYLPLNSYNGTENVSNNAQYSTVPDSGGKTFTNTPFRYMPDISQPMSETNGWILLDQYFVTVIVSLLPYLATNAKIAPSAQINDGKIHIIIIHPEISRSELVSTISKLDSGGHFESKCVGYIECLAFRLVPECGDSYMAIDGELIPNSALQAEVMPSVARTFTGPCCHNEIVLG